VAPPVLLLHGLASNASRWAEFASTSALPARHDLLRVDLRGHGESPTLGRIGLETWGADLLALLDALQAPAGILVGHSLGAQVAMHLAATAPQRVAALVLIDPVFRQALRGGNLRRAQAGPLFGAGASLVRLGYRLGLHRRDVPPLDLTAMDREARRALAGGPDAEAAFIRHYSSARADLQGFRTAHYLQEMAEMARPAPDPATLAMPVLVLLSTGATFAQLEDSRAMAGRFPNGTLDTVDCHHWPLTERPDAVRARIEAWIGGLAPAGRVASRA
jgi:pimeloyl-ACP methyl ester carboxylesterase